MSDRMNFLRSIIEKSQSSGSVGESSDSGYPTTDSSGNNPQSHGRGRTEALSNIMARRNDGGLLPENAIQANVIGGRGRFIQSLMQNVAQASERSSSEKPVAEVSARSVASEGTSGIGECASKMKNLSLQTGSSQPSSKADSVMTKESEPILYTGTTGNKVDVTSNYMELKCQKDCGIFLYTVDFEPNLDAKQARKRCVADNQNIFGKAYIFDGQILMLPKALPQKETVVTAKSPINGDSVAMKVVFRVRQRMSENVNMYNKLFRRIMNILQLSEMGRKHFDATQARIISQHKLEIWPGYVMAVNNFQGGLMLQLDVTHRVLMQMTVHAHIKTIAMTRQAQYRDIVMKSLLGAVVLTRYNKKTYRIDDVCFDANPLCKFRYGDREMTYVEYYKEQYGIEIQDHQQPLLLNRSERRVSGMDKPQEMIVCLVPEICFLTGLTDEMRKDYKVMRDIAMYTRVTPNQRMLAMQKFCENVNNNQQARSLLASWGLELVSRPTVMNGRILPHEKILSGGGFIGSAGPTADFTRQVTNNPMLEVVHIRQWLLVYTQRDEQYASIFTDCVKRNSRLLGINIAQPQIEVLPQDSTELYVQLLRTRIRPGTQIVVIICPTMREDRYAAIKRICCTEVPIPSQVINARTLANEKRNRSIVLKIILQMNCKLGGTLWAVNIPLKTTMICGIDTYHEGKQRSAVSALVGSLDDAFTHWYSRAMVQSSKEEILNGLCVSLENLLQAYRRRNCVLPDKIIIFRDGVGDSQISMCQEYEIPQLEAACKLLAPDYAPKISFIVVQKRIITRLFSTNPTEDGGHSNVPPGTIIDHTVTRPYMYDFFLVSQTVQMGTVSPTHNFVIRDDSKFAPDILQRLTYKMCYMYYNWTGSIRVPACCQYAHKLAYLVGENIKRVPAESLNDKLFYL